MTLWVYPPRMKYKFDAVFYYVTDLERAVRFYRDVLGMKLTSRDFVARFDVDGVLFELVPAERVEGSGNARLCLAVEDIEAAVRELAAKGVSATPAKRKSNGWLASFRDPDGNEICLWQYA